MEPEIQEAIQRVLDAGKEKDTPFPWLQEQGDALDALSAMCNCSTHDQINCPYCVLYNFLNYFCQS